MGCGCDNHQQIHISNCGCKETSCNPVRCRKTVTPIKDLIWLAGLDENSCEAFQRVSDVLGLRDCAGNRVSIDTPVILCSELQEEICTVLSGLIVEGEAMPASTLLVGADCKLYTIPESGSGPSSETPNSAVDSASINITLSGSLNRTIKADANISIDADNILEIHSDGLYVPAPEVSPTLCQQLADLPAGSDIETGTVLIGADCQKHVYTEPEPINILDTSSIDLTFNSNTLSADLKLDPSSIGTITGSGLLINCDDILICAPPVTILDTQSVNLNINGQQISADIVISPDANNALELHANGLYVDVCSALDDGNLPVPGVPGSTVVVGADCNRYILPTQQNIAVVDTTSVNLTLAGNNLQADVNIQPNTLLGLGAQGLHVTCEAVQDCIFTTPNNFIDYDDVGNSVSFNPSSDLGNQIITGSDGRPYVPAFSFTVNDSDCLDLTLAGNVLSGNILLSTQPNNSLECLPDGLYAPSQDVDIIGLATNCINVLVNEPTAGNFEVSATPILSPDLGNTLECRANGLYSPSPVPIIDPDVCNSLVNNPNGLFVPETTGSTDNEVLANPFTNQVVNNTDVILSAEFCINVLNESDCRSSLLTITLPIPWIEVEQNGINSQVLVEAEVEYNFPAVLVAAFAEYSHARYSTNSVPEIVGSHASDLIRSFIIPPGFIGDYCVRYRLTGEAGSVLVSMGTVNLSYTVITV